ncbi:DUF3021 domain-containing protein [Corynebacterium sp. sy039]|uniref:DUF3021 domain-containing protein n=1 Tax=Corynebacterium sp. sy039 TaxID=2599641 RepID=UPI0011B67370|nr:DUF3021 domain-containing protein [Corynebacterium sp. sy039]QDZ43267.1 DUF3021 domain-containing protein [Corynebacterium sp. sy039]
MSEEQLTVAQLLSREKKNSDPNSRPKRRRRHSIEEGGISVAELTGGIPRVDAKPVQPKHTSQPLDAEEDTADASTLVLSVVDEKDPVRLTTGSIPVIKTENTREDVQEASAKPAKVVAPQAQAEESAAVSAPESAQEMHGSSVVKLADEDKSVAAESVEAEEAELDEEYDYDYEEEESVSVGAVILMSIVGIVLGVIIFKVFEFLWIAFSKPAVSVIAVVTVAMLIGLVYFLRTNRDRLSMILAGATGLVLTFGPLLTIG